MLLRALPLVALPFAGCAPTSTLPDGPPRSYVLAGGLAVRYMAEADVDRECESRVHNGKPHWGCGTYRRDNDSCELIVKPIRNKLDWDRAALVGIELRNCLQMQSGERDW